MSRPRYNNQVREHREAAGMTQGELADAIGAGRVTVVRLEQGQQVPDVHRALELAEVLGVTVEELFGDPAEYEERTAADGLDSP